jgi:hypothetical protein
MPPFFSALIAKYVKPRNQSLFTFWLGLRVGWLQLALLRLMESALVI